MSLEVRGVSKAYGGLAVLDDVSLSVGRGALHGLIGPNGAGKSTLFSVVTGFLAPDAGSVRLGGRALDRLAAPARARAGMVRTFQVPRDFAGLTVRGNLMAAAPGQTGETLPGLFFRPGRVRREEEALRARADETIAFLRLGAVADELAGNLSGGQKKLVELGRALMTRPRLLLLDEPFAGVNPVLIEEIVARVRELHAGGLGFLIIEHDLASLARLVERLAVLDRGRIIADGPPDAVLADPRVREAYLGGPA